jgi:hypothetical protein
MSNNDKHGIQEQDLRALELRVEDMIERLKRLEDEA